MSKKNKRYNDSDVHKTLFNTLSLMDNLKNEAGKQFEYAKKQVKDLTKKVDDISVKIVDAKNKISESNTEHDAEHYESILNNLNDEYYNAAKDLAAYTELTDMYRAKSLGGNADEQ